MKDQPTTPNKLGPWSGLAVLAVFLNLVLGFVWGLVAIIGSA